MEHSINYNLPLNFEQVVQLVQQLSMPDKKRLMGFLKKSTIPKDENKVLTHFASEKVLAKDWLNPKEDQAWQDL